MSSTECPGIAAKCRQVLTDVLKLRLQGAKELGLSETQFEFLAEGNTFMYGILQEVIPQFEKCGYHFGCTTDAEGYFNYRVTW